MKESSEHRSWFQLLNQWLSGKINSQEERQLDQLAQKDAFLADAIEGYRSFPESDHLKDLTQLKAKLRKRTNPKSRLAPLFFYRTAAAAIFVGLIGGLWYYNNSLESNTDLAFQPTLEEPSTLSNIETKSNSNAVTDSIEKSLVIENEASSDIATPKAETVQNSKPKKQIEELPKPPEISISESADMAIEDAENLEPDPGAMIPPAIVLTEEDSKAKILPNAPPEKEIDALTNKNSEIKETAFEKPVFDDKMEAIALHKEISGKVIDPRGDPLSGATVLAPGTTNGVLTDVDGQFTIKLDREISTLRVDYLGYRSKQITLGKDNNLQVKMDQADIALEEIAVQADRASRKKMRSEASSKDFISPQPKGGFKNLEKYIQRKLQYPASAKEEKLEGEVKLQFVVYPVGSLSNFVVVNSLSEACDKEAIRLLQNGPKWETSTQTTVTYTVPFKLK